MAKDLKVVLLGYMGSGKSTVGDALAQKLNIPFKDLDGVIQEKEGKTISQLFHEKGELYFRKKEAYYLNQVLDLEASFVLALGGGTPCYANNMADVLQKAGTSIYLKMTLTELVLRLEGQRDTRPLIKGIKEGDLPEFIGKHLFERAPFYQRALHTVNVADKSVEALVEEIASFLV
ncbi:Shikimate kinase [Croceitalea dokdonensis DOKDO 023]|uniref:Shikimate kinase n=1 Tax=Croceitalea dokdonensis DOKDO 023 TaxID=1300341 RepID=A0A0P7AYQ7_9FLAO|nr:shikimate kinase [Croceitalea dokdonensis]KPM31563.1 Shikimate kinase [Croceitalea dokdonensis DOKDO 023]